MAHKYLPSVKDKLLSWVISDLVFYLIHLNIMYLADVVNLRKLLYRNKIQAKPKNKSFIIFHLSLLSSLMLPYIAFA